MTLKEIWARTKLDITCDILLIETNDYYCALFDDQYVILSNFQYAWRIREPIYMAAIHKDRISEILDYYQSKDIKVGIMKEQ